MRQGLPPYLPERPRILVLGSFPSRASLEAGRYYAHPRNHFWPILAALAGEALAGEARAGEARAGERASVGRDLSAARPRGEARLLPPAGPELLEALGIAIWDVYAACERDGSLDQAIRAGLPNPFLELLAAERDIVAVGLNGTAAAEAFLRGLGAAVGGRPRAMPAIGEGFSFAAPAPGAKAMDAAARRLLALRLPSTSPVPTREYRRAEDKLPAWRALLAAARAAHPAPVAADAAATAPAARLGPKG